MPQSIPFDPSLTLGNIVHPEKIKALQAVDEAQQPINLAQEKLNSWRTKSKKFKTDQGAQLLKTKSDELRSKGLTGQEIQIEALKIKKEILEGKYGDYIDFTDFDGTIVFTKDGSDVVRCYIDGVLMTNVVSSGMSGDLLIDAVGIRHNHANEFGGFIYEIMLFNTSNSALTANVNKALTAIS